MLNSDGTVRLPDLDNHAMGTIFEELVRRFNEENNEEAGEHWTPRDAVRLMARLIFEPIADVIESGTYLLYDGACGTGGMLTVAEEALFDLANERNKQVSVHLFGQEINAETYAICKADLLLKSLRARARRRITSWADPSIRLSPTTPSPVVPSTSCSPTRLMAKVGRVTWSAWVARQVSRIPALLSNTVEKNSLSLLAPAMVRCYF
ncbi:HsdM family class I SAM-dependent methyltransferase [Thermanaerovibrio velox]|uniref:HsdM family class I SAM-dependent methyltransferase n=1 Tax=Thermanaerovibrio velox TaxID=108007 RepID=UPI001FDF8968|nr:N-6 DNA methylase [Thermanaerovibrio velox]MCX7828842.1 N-6 DNA methylase [Thermanaerothrix sp.]